MCYSADTLRAITQRELRNNSGKIMRELDEGQAFVVTRNGVPVADLTPIRRGVFVNTARLLAALAEADAIDYKRLRADLDAVVDQDPSPRG